MHCLKLLSCKSPASADETRVSRTMKLEYYSLGLVFIVITHVPHVWMFVSVSSSHCCPNDPSHNETFETFEDYCQNGKEILIGTQSAGTAGIYCKTSKECFSGFGLRSFLCKISNSEESFCSNQTYAYEVCRGTLTSIAACKK